MGLRIYFTTVISDNDAKLTTEIQQLKLLRNNLTAQIQEMTYVSPAQWTIDAYCPRENNKRQCKACEKGWVHTQPNCHEINAAAWKTWEEAQEDCRGKNSDLVVLDDEAEMDLISHYSSPAIDGYWVGLRVEDGIWRWINGSDLTESSWIVAATDGQCAVSVWTNLLSVSCDSRRRWLCKKKALSV
uniref:killer cell lectin-like receptor subfamily B member 1B allele C n=1 Tax=Epinephelus lanceolatus TaxID=310571 RepID=UPI001446073A|nr:killer cell lectin-like receptor subfamily B member 1B allele C [Epinephelus lanceolatus]